MQRLRVESTKVTASMTISWRRMLAPKEARTTAGLVRGSCPVTQSKPSYSDCARIAATYALSTACAINCCPDWLGWVSQANWLAAEAFSNPALHVLPPANEFETADWNALNTSAT